MCMLLFGVFLPFFLMELINGNETLTNVYSNKGELELNTIIFPLFKLSFDILARMNSAAIT